MKFHLCCKRKDKQYPLLIQHVEKELLKDERFRFTEYGDFIERTRYLGSMVNYFQDILCKHKIDCNKKFVGFPKSQEVATIPCFCDCQKEL